MGSTSISAPQWSSQNRPWSRSVSSNRKSMNWGGEPMSSWRFLKIVSTESPSKPRVRCIRLEYTGLAPIHSSMAMSRITSRPKAPMRWGMPARSIRWPSSR